jgi:hypothetical protein
MGHAVGCRKKEMRGTRRNLGVTELAINLGHVRHYLMSDDLVIRPGRRHDSSKRRTRLARSECGCSISSTKPCQPSITALRRIDKGPLPAGEIAHPCGIEQASDLHDHKVCHPLRQ